MKYKIFGLLCWGLSLGVITPAEAQTPVIQRGKREQRNAEVASDSRLSQRAKDFSQSTIPSEYRSTWMRTVYRHLDLNKDANAPLYFPIHKTGKQANLLTRILPLVLSGDLPAYEYVDGVESYDQAHRVHPKDLVEKFSLTAKETRGRYELLAEDIPSAEVKAYYIKENHFFNEHKSRFDVSVEAICPIMTVMGEYGDQTVPMFWLRYSDVRPHLLNTTVALSNINNIASASIDDYFRLGIYDGPIVRTQNLQGLSMGQIYPNPDSLLIAQKALDSTLRLLPATAFIADSLLHQPKTVAKTKASTSTTNSRDKRVRSSASSSSNKSTSKSATSSSSSPRRSIRGRF